MSDEDFDFSEPWDIFADEDKPWTDLDRLAKWNEKLGTQAELGDAFGCHPSTISYWLDKIDDSKPDEAAEEIDCLQCGGDTPGFNLICDDCLDQLREDGRGLEEAPSSESVSV